MVVIASKEDDLSEPLDVRRIREGDVTALHYFDRYDLSVTYRDHDFGSQTFRKPVYYEVHPSYSGPSNRVHHTRVLRFDGIEPATRSGFYNYDYDFGVSVLVPIITSLMQDESFATAVAHLGQEASIAILHIQGLRETIAGGGDPNEATPEQIAQQINERKSNYRLLMLDEEGAKTSAARRWRSLDWQRLHGPVPVACGGRAAHTDTKFLGRPPKGMNATGVSPMTRTIRRCLRRCASARCAKPCASGRRF